jgi:hypothetical protein
MVSGNRGIRKGALRHNRKQLYYPEIELAGGGGGTERHHSSSG